MSIPFATQNMIYLVYHNIAWRRQIFYEQRAQRTDNAIILRKQGGGGNSPKNFKIPSRISILHQKHKLHDDGTYGLSPT